MCYSNILSLAQLPSLYVHVPFCLKKCDYCAFYSLSLGQGAHGRDFRSHSLVEIYLEGLAAEMRWRQKDTPLGVSSLFIGGGTPTALSETELEVLLTGINKYFRFEASAEKIAEKTVEGNPGTLTPGKLSALRTFGINRFSLGVQSFNDELLRQVGRMHCADDARRSIKELRAAGFDNLNLDLMFGLPGQDLRTWQKSVEEALAWAPEHLSVYGLMLEEGTELFKRVYPGESVKEEPYPLTLPDDDLQADMYDWAVGRLERAGYVRYETSNFARPGYECQHNLTYWHGREYLGLGPGAVSFQGRVRSKNVEDIPEYRELARAGREAPEEREELSERERMTERVILGLRLAQGVDLAAFARDFGVRLEDIYRDVLEKYESQGILFREKGYLKLNPRYFFIANAVLQEFL